MIRLLVLLLFVADAQSVWKLMHLMRQECRSFVAVEVPGSDWQVIGVALKTHFDEFLAASSAERGGPCGCAAFDTLGAAVWNQQATVRIEAEHDIIDAMEE